MQDFDDVIDVPDAKRWANTLRILPSIDQTVAAGKIKSKTNIYSATRHDKPTSKSTSKHNV